MHYAQSMVVYLYCVLYIHIECKVQRGANRSHCESNAGARQFICIVSVSHGHLMSRYVRSFVRSFILSFFVTVFFALGLLELLSRCYSLSLIISFDLILSTVPTIHHVDTRFSSGLYFGHLLLRSVCLSIGLGSRTRLLCAIRTKINLLFICFVCMVSMYYMKCPNDCGEFYAPLIDIEMKCVIFLATFIIDL